MNQRKIPHCQVPPHSSGVFLLATTERAVPGNNRMPYTGVDVVVDGQAMGRQQA